MYESGGHYGKSRIVKRTLDNIFSKEENFVEIDEKYFAEGIDFYYENEELYLFMLTWREREILKFNHKGDIVEKINIPSEIAEGWGITHDPNNPNIFFISDGTNKIFECDAKDNFRVIKNHSFSYNGNMVYYINELEFLNGKILANVYYQNVILELDITNDTVERVFYLPELIENA